MTACQALPLELDLVGADLAEDELAISTVRSDLASTKLSNGIDYFWHFANYQLMRSKAGACCQCSNLLVVTVGRLVVNRFGFVVL